MSPALARTYEPRAPRKQVRSLAVPNAPEPKKLRLRLAAWGRYCFVMMRQANPTAMAVKMGHPPTTLRRILLGEQDPGLDFAVRLAGWSGLHLNLLCFEDPPNQFFAQGVPPPGTPLEPFPRPRKQGDGGGQ